MIILETNRLVVESMTLNIGSVRDLLLDAEIIHYLGNTNGAKKIFDSYLKMFHHYRKHGFGFGHVTEKKSRQLIGGAGLSYLELNDTQPHIEVGVTLNKQFWNKGYATELTKAFIQWGFTHLSLKKIMAVVHPKNLRYKRVLEKSGMHYVSPLFCYGMQLDFYEIADIKGIR